MYVTQDRLLSVSFSFGEQYCVCDLHSDNLMSFTRWLNSIYMRRVQNMRNIDQMYLCGLNCIYTTSSCFILPVWDRDDVSGVFWLQHFYPLLHLSLSAGNILNVEQSHIQLLLKTDSTKEPHQCDRSDWKCLCWISHCEPPGRIWKEIFQTASRQKKSRNVFFFESNFCSGGFVSCPVNRMKCWMFLLIQFVCVTGYVSYWHFYKTCHIMFTSHGCDLAWWSGRSRKGCWASDNSSRLCFNIIKSETTRYF